MINGSVFHDLGNAQMLAMNPDEVFNEIKLRQGHSSKVTRDPDFVKQNEVLDSRGSRWKALNCSRRSGKSHTEARDHIEICLEYPKSRTIYMGLTLDSVTEIIWDVFKELNEAHKLGLKFNNSKKIIFYPNGSRTRLFGLDASHRQMAKVLGQKLRKVSIDEAGSITVDLEEFCFQKLRPALSDLAPLSWLTLLGTCETIPNTYFQRVTEGKCELFDWNVFKWTAYENPHMVNQWTAEMEEIKQKTPLALETASFKTHYLNIWCYDENLLIIPASKMGFEDRLPVLKRGQEWHYMLGVDLGYNDATAYTLIAFSWNHPTTYVCMTIKQTQQDFTDVANTIKSLKSDFDIVSIVVDGANKQGVEEIKKRHNLPEIQIAEKMGKATYLRLIRDEIIQQKLKFISGEATESLKKEYEALMWKDSMKVVEDPRCQNHLSDSTLYIWRLTYTMRATEKKETPKQNDPKYEDHLEEIENQKAQQELLEEEEIYGQKEEIDEYFQTA